MFSDETFREKLISILKGAAIAAGGAALTALGEYFKITDFGAWTPAVVMIASSAINAVRKLLPPVVSTAKSLLS